jgi:flagellin
MTSIMTNSSAMSALQTLRSIGSSLETTQSRISSGFKVGTAADNAGYWSIATTMRSDSKSLSAVNDALGLGAAKVDTAATGMNSAISVVSDIKAKLVAAREPGVDKSKINKELDALKSQLTSISKSASFSGENWLYNTSTTAAGTKDIVGSFNRDAGGNVSVGVLSIDTGASVLIDTNNAQKGLLTKGTDVTQNISGSTGTTTATYFLINATSTTTASGTGTPTEIKIDTTTSDVNISGMISAVDAMLTKMTDAGSTLGATTSRIKMQDDFVTSLRGTIDRGVGRLVDADMNEESTKLKALQTQQQLGIQALSIANSESQNVLSLFR